MKQHSLILSLGSNSADGAEKLSKAEQILRSWIRLDVCSRILKNPAIGMGNEAEDFHNMLIKTKTTLSLNEMQALAKTLEHIMGNSQEMREKGIVNMDMDIISWDDILVKPKDVEREYYKELAPSISPQDSPTPSLPKGEGY